MEKELGTVRHDYTADEIMAIYNLPLPRLIFNAQAVHRSHFNDDEVQLSTLLSVKTGGCKEDCAYCPQSAHHDVELKAKPFFDRDEILQAATEAQKSGSTRFCMGAAWRSPPKKGKAFDELLEAATSVKKMGLEVCMTLGMLDDEQAQQLKSAGVDYYNHNLDSSKEFYEKIISTRTYQDRLDTLARVRKAGMSVCCGGIIGMGESILDRAQLLETLNHLDPHPESVPINMLVKVEGTPLAQADDIDPLDLVRMIATARIVLPESQIRLSAGRRQMSDETHALCFIAGANSIFTGDKLLTTENPGDAHDRHLLQRMGMRRESIETATL